MAPITPKAHIRRANSPISPADLRFRGEYDPPRLPQQHGQGTQAVQDPPRVQDEFGVRNAESQGRGPPEQAGQPEPAIQPGPWRAQAVVEPGPECAVRLVLSAHVD